MINVRFYANHGKLCLRVQGHAKSGPKGEDVVCAGVSTLAGTLADFMTLLSFHGELAEKPDIRMSQGDAFIKIRPTEKSCGRILFAFSEIAAGMSALARNYPEFIRLSLFDRAEIEEFRHSAINVSEPAEIEALSE